MILMRENPLLGSLEGVGPEISTILGPKNYQFQGPPPPLPMALVIDSARIKSFSPASYKQQVLNSYFLTLVQKESAIRSLPFQGTKKS